MYVLGRRSLAKKRRINWLAVSTAGYYEWRGRPASAAAARRDRLTLLIRAVFDGSDGTYGTYGHRRIHAQLARWGEHAGPELVRAGWRRRSPAIHVHSNQR